MRRNNNGKEKNIGFSSDFDFKLPDKNAYESQKNVQFINERLVNFPADVSPPLDNVSWVGESWGKYHGLMIDLAAKNHTKPKNGVFPRTFPGAVISGPKSGNEYVGALAWETFKYTMTIPERVIDVKKLNFDKKNGMFIYKAKRPKLEFAQIPSEENWKWDIKQPKLNRMELGQSKQEVSRRELGRKQKQLFQYLNQHANIFLNSFRQSTSIAERNASIKVMLELVQFVLTPFVRNQIPNEVVNTSREVLESYLNKNQSFALLPLLFQLESSLMYAKIMNEREKMAEGFFSYSWIEVARTPVELIRSTELIDEKRAIDEVVSIFEKGWAPIITDERMNNTDGSHRAIAARVWSLLHYLSENKLIRESIGSKRLQNGVKSFVKSRKDMTGLTLRETLRVTQALLDDPKYSKQKSNIFQAIKRLGDVTHVPTILLREQEACCVVKSPFDESGKIIGVDPLVEFTLTNGRSDLTLGSRGPYHRSDKTPAPWFDIFSMQ